MVLSCFSFQLSAQQATAQINEKNPYEMIEQVAIKTFKRFSIDHSAIRKDPNILKNIVREELMPYVHHKYTAYKVLGTNLKPLKTKTPEQVDEFVDVFLEYLVTEYAQVFTLYNNQKVEFEPSKDTKKKKILAVKTVIIDPKLGEIEIAFKVRKNKKTLEWKAFDMVAEGVSLLDSKKAELNTLIRQKGLPHTIALLKEKSNRNIEFKKL